MNRATVLGAGEWGATLAWLLAEAGNEVLLWTRRAELVNQSESSHKLPSTNLELPKGLRLVGDLREALEPELVFVAVPPAYVRPLIAKGAESLRPGHRVVHVVKGFEPGGRPISRVITDTSCVLKVAALAGPMVPSEMWAGGLSASVVGSVFDGLVDEVCERLAGPRLRVYGSSDVAGVEVGGAMRTPMALASGLVRAAGLGDAILSVLLTRGLAEAGRLAVAMGGERNTLAGLSGIGDWMHTAWDDDDPVVRAGMALAKNGSCPHPEAGTRIETLAQMATEKKLYMPITQAIETLLRGAPLEEVLRGLMARTSRAEMD